MNDSPIGIFDSGMGGLTVLRALIGRLPNEHTVYLGDTARLPYGTKSSDTVARYAMQAAQSLITRRVKLLVIACNTASASALPALTEAFAPIPVIGVIEPGAEAAVAAALEGPIAVIATEGTVKGGAYTRAILERANGIEVIQLACPL
ncbi:MAG: glutamate racemase, partial [Rhizomicrobium sp.]